MKALFPPNTQQIFRTSSQPCSLCGGSPPLPSFAADPEGLGYLLVYGIHRWPEDLARFIHIEPAPPDTPTTFYTRVFLHPLRFPALRALELPDPDVNAIEQATRSALLAMPLLQALDYLHTQLLSGLASRHRPAALSLATKCSTQCAANLTPSPADSLTLVKPCNRFYLPHFGVG